MNCKLWQPESPLYLLYFFAIVAIVAIPYSIVFVLKELCRELFMSSSQRYEEDTA